VAHRLELVSGRLPAIDRKWHWDQYNRLTFLKSLGRLAAMSLGPAYHRLWTASALSNLADGVFQVALPLLAVRLAPDSPGLVAGVVLAGRLPWLLFVLQAGALADRLDRRRTMINVDVARAALLGGLALITAFGHEEMWILYVVAFTLGVFETLFDTAAQSIMPAIVDREELSFANGRLYAVELTMNQFVGPPIGGLMAAAAIAAGFGISAACYLGAAVALIFLAMPPRPVKERPARRSMRAEIAEGLRYLYRHHLLRRFAVMVGLMNMLSFAVFAVFPAWAVSAGGLDLSEQAFGFLLTTLAFGSLAGSLLAGRLEAHFGRRPLLVACACATPLLAVYAVTNVAVLAVTGIVIGLCGVVWNVITVSLRQRIVPDHLLGRLNAAYRLLAWGTMPLGALLGGVLAEVFGMQMAFAICGALGLVLVPLGLGITEREIVDAEATVDDVPAHAVTT
jgi:MFS family permease